MKNYPLRVFPSSEPLPHSQQLAFRLARVALDPAPVSSEVTDMVINRLIDNTAVCLAALTHDSVTAARDQAHCHRAAQGGARVIGSGVAVSPEWAAYANGVAARELDFHDTFLAAEYAHPADSIPPVLAAAEHCGASGSTLISGITAAYEVHIALARALNLHHHKIDHIAHTAPAATAGIGAVLGLSPEILFHAIGQALHTSTTTRQSRKGHISTWKAYAPAFAGKVAIEAIDRAMRGQSSPEPIYEGEDAFIAALLDGPEVRYEIVLPEAGETKTAILSSYPKQYAAEYQAQAWIDLALDLHERRPDLLEPNRIQAIVLHTSHHTHRVIGTGASDPQKYDPGVSRETLDHSLPYIFAVALQDGAWHHEHSYARERAHRPETLHLWRRISTREDPTWTARYHSPQPEQRAFGGRAEFTLSDGELVEVEIDVPHAHPLGAHPFRREDYVKKLLTLADGTVEDREITRFLHVATDLPAVGPGHLGTLNVRALPHALPAGRNRGLFDTHPDQPHVQ